MPTSMPDTDYINTLDYTKLEKKLKDTVSVMESLNKRNSDARKMRYVEVNIESERAAGRIGVDEVYVPQHIIDTNIRREQASYVQYVTQSNRACILQDLVDPSLDTTVLERDLTNKIRYNDWQIPVFANIDGMQQNGYGVLEHVFDESKPGHMSYDFVQLGDLGLPVDTKDIQEAECITRNYYFSKTRLLEMAQPGSPWMFSLDQVERITDAEPNGSDDITASSTDRSLYRIQKAMFRVNGVVHVAWIETSKCSDWIRVPRPLFIGRKKAVQVPVAMGMIMPSSAPVQAQVTWEDEFESDYPYYIFPYLISENNTLDKLKGRVFLDQETQTAVTSMISSVCTAYRRGSGLYFSKDVEDPNDDMLLQKNVSFKTGALINSKIKQFQLTVPDPSVLGAIQALVTANQAETSKVNFAAQNRKDSRKTATEISAASQEAANLSTVQVVLFSTALKKLYTCSFNVIKTRVAAGLIIVNDNLKALYAREYSVRPSGDVDVIERQQLVAAMMQAWPVVQQTPAAQAFLTDLLMKMFPDSAPKYVKIFEEAQAKQQTAEAQQQAMMMQTAEGIGKNIIELSKRPEMFSETGKVHALPIIQQTAQQLASFIKPEQV
jgi:hypothetical protein